MVQSTHFKLNTCEFCRF